jgi:phosphopentomutase
MGKTCEGKEMTKQGRVFVFMMDSFGIGGAPDAGKYANEGANTLGHIAAVNLGLKISNLLALGLGDAAKGASGVFPAVGAQPPAALRLPSKFGHAREISVDKDTVSGHWEMAGLPNLQGWGHFPPQYPSFPAELTNALVNEAGLAGILGNKAASGTVIIQELGEEHIRSGKPICYTSADSCFQIAAHEKYFGLERLYDVCETAYRLVQPYHIGRIIARPFVGERAGEFARTVNRRDYAAQPFGETLLDRLKAAGHEVVAVGAINDIYAHRGITKGVRAAGLEALWDATLREMNTAPSGSLVFTNFEDFDMLYGHRRDVKGYARALEYFDRRLPEILPFLQDDDLVFITADHGNDPTYDGTDHTREQVPVLMFGRKAAAEDIGQRDTYADIGQTIAAYLEIRPLDYGVSFL